MKVYYGNTEKVIDIGCGLGSNVAFLRKKRDKSNWRRFVG